ncbi:cyclic lactone autoinducer peptide [Eubacterium sp. LFL-14]|uniref:Cyclic lactone autoinducer peptide n=1 Tax=Eubacterium album TaxID=2978477 RepID=A0ABT2M689_9FIRM|nr:cyclic lactone autoinducer peptide [Eubacterium sp. LFL-14]MCT7399773.1 cyclic lactone autoinducer peptide [Eubacterium sp. LFL-14]
MVIKKKGGSALKDRNVITKTARLITGSLDLVLKSSANSTSCGVLYQPKAPKTLERFRNKKK